METPKSTIDEGSPTSRESAARLNEHFTKLHKGVTQWCAEALARQPQAVSGADKSSESQVAELSLEKVHVCCIDERVSPSQEEGVFRIAGSLVALPREQWPRLVDLFKRLGVSRVVLQVHQHCGALALQQRSEGATHTDLWEYSVERARELASFLRAQEVDVSLQFLVYPQGGASVANLAEGEELLPAMLRALDEPECEEHEAVGVVVAVGGKEMVAQPFPVPRGMFVVSALAEEHVEDVVAQVRLALAIAFGEHNVFHNLLSSEAPFTIVVAPFPGHEPYGRAIIELLSHEIEQDAYKGKVRLVCLSPAEGKQRKQIIY